MPIHSGEAFSMRDALPGIAYAVEFGAILETMCGRFERSCSDSIIRKAFSLSGDDPAPLPSFNVAPFQDIAVIVNREGQRRLISCRWGFVPSWADPISFRRETINARAETVAAKPLFRSAFRHHRCLVIANGFFEWRRQGRSKVPYHIRLKTGKPFGFAGLSSRLKPEAGKEICTCAIITTEANEVIRRIHDRMPVIVPAEQEDLWLDPDANDPRALQEILKPYPAAEMEMHEVSAQVNFPAFDTPEAVRPVE